MPSLFYYGVSLVYNLEKIKYNKAEEHLGLLLTMIMMRCNIPISSMASSQSEAFSQLSCRSTWIRKGAYVFVFRGGGGDVRGRKEGKKTEHVRAQLS